MSERKVSKRWVPVKPQFRPRGRGRSNRGRNQQRAPTAPTGRSADADTRFFTPISERNIVRRFKYDELGLTTTGTSGFAGNYFFSANALYDPNITGGGHSAIGFLEMMARFNHYTVISSKITATVINASASGVYAVAGVYLAPDTSSITIGSRLLENGYMVHETLYPIGVYGSKMKLSLNCSVPKYFDRLRGNARALLNDPNLSGAAASNPTEQVYFVVCTFDGAGSSTTQISIQVTIEYVAYLWEARKLTQS